MAVSSSFSFCNDYYLASKQHFPFRLKLDALVRYAISCFLSNVFITVALWTIKKLTIISESWWSEFNVNCLHTECFPGETHYWTRRILCKRIINKGDK